jgi:hypothetical protein
MQFSEHFKIQRTDNDDWFDPIMSVDTPLFLDPFLLYDGEDAEFQGCHQEIIAFFNSIFGLIAQSKGDPSKATYKKALNSLVFPEVAELCLGFTSQGTSGSGYGYGYIWGAKRSLESLRYHRQYPY